MFTAAIQPSRWPSSSNASVTNGEKLRFLVIRPHQAIDFRVKVARFVTHDLCAAIASIPSILTPETKKAGF